MYVSYFLILGMRCSGHLEEPTGCHQEADQTFPDHTAGTEDIQRNPCPQTHQPRELNRLDRHIHS